MAQRPFTPLEAGRLRERITVRQLADAPDGSGGFVRDWATVPGMESVPAEVVGQSGRESVIANTLQGIATYRITIRFREGIAANMQILWRGQELNVLAPPTDPTGRRELLQIFADTSAPEQADD